MGIAISELEHEVSDLKGEVGQLSVEKSGLEKKMLLLQKQKQIEEEAEGDQQRSKVGDWQNLVSEVK